MLRKIRNITVTAALSVLLIACSSTEEGPKYTTEKEFYEAAQRQLNARQWEVAIQNLQALEENFPFGTYAEQAQLELIYAYFSNYEHDASAAAADRFIRLHPQHRNVDYAYYMKGLASFTEGNSLFERFLPTDLTTRDPGSARDSFAHFSELLARYPNSEYAPDARKRMIYLRNLLARAEIHAANYYMKRGAHLAAVNRGRYVVENFQQTPAIPDALAVMVQSYHELGMDDVGQKALQTLKKNFSNHPVFDEDGNFDYDYAERTSDRSLIHLLTLGLFQKKDPLGFDTRELYSPEYLSRAEELSQIEAEEPSFLNKATFGIMD